MTLFSDIMGVVHNLVHQVRCKALAIGTAEEASYESDRLVHWARLVSKVREVEEQMVAVKRQRDEKAERLRRVVSAVVDASERLTGDSRDREDAYTLLADAISLGMSTSPPTLAASQPAQQPKTEVQP